MRTVLIIVGVAVAGAVAIIIFKRMNGIGLEKLGPPPPLTKDCGSISNFFSGHVGRKNAVAPSVISSYTGASKEQAQGIADIAAKFDVSQYAEKYIGEKIAGWFCGKDFGDILSSIGGGIKDAAVAVGEGVKDAAVAVGEGVKDAAVFVGKNTAKGAKEVGKAVVTTAKSDTTKAIATGGASLVVDFFTGKKRLMNAAEREAAAKAKNPNVEIVKTDAGTGKTRAESGKTGVSAGAKTPIVYAATAEQRAADSAASAAAARAAAEAPPIAPPKTTTYSQATPIKTTAPTFSTLGRKTF